MYILMPHSTFTLMKFGNVPQVTCLNRKLHHLNILKIMGRRKMHSQILFFFAILSILSTTMLLKLYTD